MSVDVTPCPLCGGVTLAPVAAEPPLLTVSDYLVRRALAKLGVLLTRGRAHGGSRSLQTELRARGLPDDRAWILCVVPEAVVDKAITLSTDDWRVIALMVGDGSLGFSARRVQAVLTDYVHDVVQEARPHSTAALQRRLHTDLGLEVHPLAEAASA